jgi:hypothetical protein
MSEKFVETPIEPHSSRRDIADRINRAFSTSDITAICQRLRGVQPSVASSDDHKIALNVRSGSKAKYSERADDFRLTLRTDITKHEPYVGKMPGTDLARAKNRTSPVQPTLDRAGSVPQP